jgi:hypothetical protein
MTYKIPNTQEMPISQFAKDKHSAVPRDGSKRDRLQSRSRIRDFIYSRINSRVWERPCPNDLRDNFLTERSASGAGATVPRRDKIPL